jgi:hypothetical protein
MRDGRNGPREIAAGRGGVTQPSAYRHTTRSGGGVSEGSASTVDLLAAGGPATAHVEEAQERDRII